MKRLSLFFVLAASLTLFACGGNKSVDANDAQEVADAKGTTYQVDLAGSTIEWTGKKVAYGHSGTIQMTSGEVMAENGQISGGKFVIDMNTIKNTDIEDAEKNGKLVGHLSGADFFDVAQNPTSSFEITKVENGTVSGNLTIKGVTKNISFPAQVTLGENDMTASAEFSINRTDWNIQYSSGSFFKDLAADAIIDDMIDFKVNLKGQKAG
ncbi:MAG: YceI family protein [Bacteroidia bacterium]|nr:YceI family protein [Bacteroidia bacterium]